MSSCFGTWVCSADVGSTLDPHNLQTPQNTQAFQILEDSTPPEGPVNELSYIRAFNVTPPEPIIKAGPHGTVLSALNSHRVHQ